MELIKREDAIKATWKEPSYTDPLNVLTEVRDRINGLPTIDAVPVVRCGECIKQHGCQFAQYQGNNGYCSLGERRES